MTFKLLNLQRPHSGDPLADLNWQSLQDNTKGGTYVPTTPGITPGSGSIVTEGQFQFIGPFVMVRILISAAGTFNNWGTGGEILLPTQTLVTGVSGSIGIIQYLRIIDATHFVSSPCLIQNDTGISRSPGVVKVPSALWQAGIVNLIVDGNYLRN